MTTTRRTRRWRGVVAVTLLSAAVGVLAARPTLLLLAAASAVYAAYPYVTSAPTAAYEVERRVSPESPTEGDLVSVDVVVTNASGEYHADTRVVDGVPPMLAVESGSPRHATALRAGESSSFSYEVRATAGTHAFEPTTVAARDASGALEVEATAETETTLSVSTPEAALPPLVQSTPVGGRIAADRGGEGVEFHRVREYRPGDPLSRIDWRRYARSRELSTVDYRVEGTSSVVLCVDARACAYRSRDEGEPHAVAHGVAAAERLLTTLHGTENRVGVAALAPDPVWLAPGRGAAHATRARRLLATDPALSAYPPARDDSGDGDSGGDPTGGLTRLRENLGAHAHVLFLTPLPDQSAVEAALTLAHDGHAVTVLSPDVTGDGSRGRRLARARRRASIRTLRAAGVPVVDWDTEQSVGRAIARASERWSR